MKCLSIFANLKKLKAKIKKKQGPMCYEIVLRKKQMFLGKNNSSFYLFWLAFYFFGGRGTFQQLNQIVQR
jgi:hypothetical protein